MSDGQSGQVDLSVCQVGDVCHLRDGGTAIFESFDNDPEWPANARMLGPNGGGGSWCRDGSCSNKPDPVDIVRVTRNGEQITPAPERVMKENGTEPKTTSYPSVQAMLDDTIPEFAEVFRTGVEVREAVKAVREFNIMGGVSSLPKIADAIEAVMEHVEAVHNHCAHIANDGEEMPDAAQPAATGEGEGDIGEIDTVAEQLQMKISRLEGELETYRRASTYWWMHYCKASGREPHTTVTADAEYIREFDAIRDALWVCMKHNELHHGENHNTVIQAAAALKGWQPSAPPSPPAEVECDGLLDVSKMSYEELIAENNRMVQKANDARRAANLPSPPQRAQIITGPGKYRTEGFDESEYNQDVWIATIDAVNDEWAFGCMPGNSYIHAWHRETGVRREGTNVKFKITGPYAPPPPSVHELVDGLKGLANAPRKLDLLARWNDEVYPTLRRKDGTPLHSDGDEVQLNLRSWAESIRRLLNLAKLQELAD